MPRITVIADYKVVKKLLVYLRNKQYPSHRAEYNAVHAIVGISQKIRRKNYDG